MKDSTEASHVVPPLSSKLKLSLPVPAYRALNEPPSAWACVCVRERFEGALHSSSSSSKKEMKDSAEASHVVPHRSTSSAQ
eukprot:11516-Heterococcus_DN1.PRE.1